MSKSLHGCIAEICGKDIENIEQKAAISKVAGWANRFVGGTSKKGRYLFGQSFFGKTTCLTALKMASLFFANMRIIECNTLYYEVQAKGRSIDDVLNYDFIAFDDFGAEPLTLFGQPFMQSIILSHYSKKKPFIITSNLPPFEVDGKNLIVENYGNRVFNRLVTDCDFVRFGEAGEVKTIIPTIL